MPLCKKRAAGLAFLLSYKEEDFSTSSVWLHSFKVDTVCHVATVELFAVNQDGCEKWIEKAVPVLQEYERDIYNVGETALFFFKLFPEQSLAMKGETCHTVGRDI